MEPRFPTASGPLTLTGRAGTVGGPNTGIYVRIGSTVTSTSPGAVGAITLNGTGGPGDNNYGVENRQQHSASQRAFDDHLGGR